MVYNKKDCTFVVQITNMAVVVQKLERSVEDKFELAKRYYKIIFLVNNLPVTDTEASLVAYSSIYGTISTPKIRKDIVDKMGIAKESIYNISSKLQKLGILIKDSDNKVRVNPNIMPGFDDGQLILAIKLYYDTRNNK